MLTSQGLFPVLEKAAYPEEQVVYPDTVKIHFHSISLSGEETNAHRKAVGLSGDERYELVLIEQSRVRSY